MSKKIWSARSCLSDHLSVAASIPKIYDAYVGCNAVPPAMNEAVMVTVNSVNDCPYCAGLHGELARMAGVDNAQKIMSAGSASEAASLATKESCAAVGYAHGFAERGGRGVREDDEFAKIVASYGPGKASSIRALCWFLLWGSLGGNTINAFAFGRLCGKPQANSSFVFELVFFLWYGLLFGVIAVLNAMLKYMPKVPGFVSASIGFVLTTCASIWVLPVALVSVLTSPCRRAVDASMDGREPLLAS